MQFGLYALSLDTPRTSDRLDQLADHVKALTISERCKPVPCNQASRHLSRLDNSQTIVRPNELRASDQNLNPSDLHKPY